jgi:hypothetical protein
VKLGRASKPFSLDVELFVDDGDDTERVIFRPGIRDANHARMRAIEAARLAEKGTEGHCTVGTRA